MDWGDISTWFLYVPLSDFPPDVRQWLVDHATMREPSGLRAPIAALAIAGLAALNVARLDKLAVENNKLSLELGQLRETVARLREELEAEG